MKNLVLSVTRISLWSVTVTFHVILTTWGYRWTCITCQDRNISKAYEGETGRSGRVRLKEHLKDLEKKRSKRVLFKHKISYHKSEEVKFKFEITGKFKDALTRQSNEAVRINNRRNIELLNSKSEFNHPPVARVVVEKKKWNKGTHWNENQTNYQNSA